MKNVSLFFFVSLLSLSATFAQINEPTNLPTTAVIKKDSCDCDCRCRDVVYNDCGSKPFTSLKVDTVAGRISLFSNIAWQPMRLREQLSNGSYRSTMPTYLTWDFIEGEGALVRGLYWGGQFGMGIPFGGRFDESKNTTFEIVPNVSWYFGTHLTADLFRARRFKIFAMANIQGAFDRIRINRNEAPFTQGSWLTFIQQNAGNDHIEYQTLLDNMRNTQRDRVNINQFNVQAQFSLGADILLNPNGFALRVQGGYQLPLNLNSAWRYSYSENLEDDDSRTYRFRINNTPFSSVQEGVFAKISLTWLINKGQNCQKRVRRECCDDYRYSGSNNNDNNNNGTIIIPNNPRPNRIPRTPTPRIPTPTPRTPTPKPIPR